MGTEPAALATNWPTGKSSRHWAPLRSTVPIADARLCRLPLQLVLTTALSAAIDGVVFCEPVRIDPNHGGGVDDDDVAAKTWRNEDRLIPHFAA